MSAAWEKTLPAVDGASARRAALRLAQAHTGRTAVLGLLGEETRRGLAQHGLEVEALADAKPATLCAALAGCADRVAAIMIEPAAEASEPLLRRLAKKSRELASAEGALLVWDETAEGAAALRARFGLVPDLACGEGWLAGRAAVLEPRLCELNAYETEYLRAEIFDEQAYLRHGVELPPHAVVFDVGANIGLFSLFVMSRRPEAAVHAFEPAPDAFACLERNAARFGGRVRGRQAGMSDAVGESELLFYPGYSVLSTFHPEPAKDAAVIVNSMTAAQGEAARPGIESLVAQRLSERRAVRCSMTTVSAELRAAGLERLDLLKIDAERSERAVLAGIEDADWPKIRQLVVEAHDEEARAHVQALLERRGFQVTVDREPGLAASGISNLYAVRR